MNVPSTINCISFIRWEHLLQNLQKWSPKLELKHCICNIYTNLSYATLSRFLSFKPIIYIFLESFGLTYSAWTMYSTCKCMCIWVHICICECMYVWACMYVSICLFFTCVSTYVHVGHVCACVYVHFYVCIYACMHICTCFCMHEMYVCVCVYIQEPLSKY